MDTFKKVAFTDTPTCRLLVSKFKAKERERRQILEKSGGEETASFPGDFNFKNSKNGRGGMVAAAVRQWLVERTAAGSPNRPVVRPPETFVLPPAATERELVEQFVRHVFVRYEVPRWFYKVWECKDLPDEKPSSRYSFTPIRPLPDIQKDWFVAVVQGKNLSTVEGLPVVLTKKMAHHALTAPAHFSLVQAFRWGQVMGLPEGTAAVARVVAGSFLGKNFQPDEVFWGEQIGCLVRNSDWLDRSALEILLDFLRRSRSEAFQFYQDLEVVPPQKFNLENVDDWKKFIEKAKIARFVAEKPPELLAMYQTGGHTRNQRKRFRARPRHEFRQLMTAEEFAREGFEMRHCVGGYFQKFERGDCQIWSMAPRRPASRVPAHRLTIELEGKKVVQVRGFRNRPASDFEQLQLKIWVAARRLKM